MCFVTSALGLFQMANFCRAVNNLYDRDAFVETLFNQPIFWTVQEDTVLTNIPSKAKLTSASGFKSTRYCCFLLFCVVKRQPSKCLGQNCTRRHPYTHCVLFLSERKKEKGFLLGSAWWLGTESECCFCWSYISVTESRKDKIVFLVDVIDKRTFFLAGFTFWKHGKQYLILS